MNNKQITYSHESEDIFTKLINFLKRLQLFTQKNKQVYNYLLYGILLIVLGLVVWINS